MRQTHLVVALLAGLLLVQMGSANAATIINFSTGNFTGWAPEAVVAGPGESFSGQSQTIGGNPGANYQFEQNFDDQILVAYFPADNALTLDPSTHPSLLTIVELSGGPNVGVSFGLIAKQGGNFLSIPGLKNGTGPAEALLISDGWTDQSIGVQPFSFATPPFVAPATLDLSGTGSPIQLGFYTLNGGASSSQLRAGRIDNLSVTATTVPVPGAAILFLSGLAVLRVRLRSGFFRRKNVDS